MRIQRTKLITTSLLTLLYCTTALADHMVCPSVEKIRQMAPYMTDATRFNGHAYQVKSSTALKDNDASWDLTTVLVIAENKKEAARLAQERSSKVTDKVYNVEKRLFSGEESCLYYEKTGKNPYVSIMAHSY